MSGCGCGCHDGKDAAAPEAVQGTVFTIPDMTCGHCEKTLRNAFAQDMPGAGLGFDLPAHRLTVTGDADKARAVIVSAGFTPDAG